MLLILVYRQQTIKMQGARPRLQSDSASKDQQQKLQVTPVLVVEDEGKPSESVGNLIKQQEYLPLTQAKLWAKFMPVRVCKNKIRIYTHSLFDL
jgi:hypothetical protein